MFYLSVQVNLTILVHLLLAITLIIIVYFVCLFSFKVLKQVLKNFLGGKVYANLSEQLELHVS